MSPDADPELVAPIVVVAPYPFTKPRVPLSIVMLPEVDKILTASSQTDQDAGPPEEVMSMSPDPVEIVEDPMAYTPRSPVDVALMSIIPDVVETVDA